MSSPTPKSAGKIGSAGPNDSRIDVVFYRTDDRYRHEVVVQVAGKELVVLSSDEGSPEELWPASPALQQLSIETRDRSQVALLVGMAGKSHYSAGIESFPDQGRVCFDIACRVGQIPEFVGSTYKLHSLSKQSVLITTDASAQASSDKDVVSITPVSVEAPPTTVRWQFAVSLK